MAQGENAKFKLKRDFYSRRPLSYFSRNKVNKVLCHRIERARERVLLLEEKKDIPLAES